MSTDRPSSITPAGKWLAFAALCVFTAAAWMGAIERANYNAGHLLQQLNNLPREQHSAAWGSSVSRESLRAEIAVDAAGDPLAEPIPIALEEQVDHAWRPYAAKRHLKLMLTGFAPIIYPSLALALFAGFRSFYAAGNPLTRGLAVGLLALTVVVLARSVFLGVIRHGWLA